MPTATRLGRPKGSHRQVTLKKIFPVARRLFSDKGFAQTTFKDVGKALGMSHAALYTYFPNKLALYLATVRETQQLLLPWYIEAASIESSLRDRLVSILEAMARAHDEDESITGLLAAVPIEMRRHPEIFEVLTHEDDAVMPLLINMFEEAKSTGEILSDLPAEDLIAAIFGAGVGVALLHYGLYQENLSQKMAALIELFNGSFFRPLNETRTAQDTD